MELRNDVPLTMRDQSRAAILVNPDNYSVKQDLSMSQMSQIISLQAKKIQSLLRYNESIGAENAQLKSAKNELEKIKLELEEMQAWHMLCFRRLGGDLNTASHHLDVLFARSKQLDYPGYRLVYWTDRRFGRTWIGRGTKWFLRTIYLIRCA